MTESPKTITTIAEAQKRKLESIRVFHIKLGNLIHTRDKALFAINTLKDEKMEQDCFIRIDAGLNTENDLSRPPACRYYDFAQFNLDEPLVLKKLLLEYYNRVYDELNYKIADMLTKISLAKFD